jgi:hypothetical protein
MIDNVISKKIDLVTDRLMGKPKKNFAFEIIEQSCLDVRRLMLVHTAVRAVFG